MRVCSDRTRILLPNTSAAVSTLELPLMLDDHLISKQDRRFGSCLPSLPSVERWQAEPPSREKVWIELLAWDEHEALAGIIGVGYSHNLFRAL